MNKFPIPVTELENGIKQCFEQAKLLLESSKLLLEKEKYPSSISLSILCREEITKIQVMSLRLKQKSPIPKDLWRELNQHKTKLVLPHLITHERLKKKTPKQLLEMQKMFSEAGFDIGEDVSIMDISLSEKMIQFLAMLDLLKQDCQFVSWENSQWDSFQMKYDSNTQKDIAEVMYQEALRDYLAKKMARVWKPNGPLYPKTKEGKRWAKNTKYVNSHKFKELRVRVYRIIHDNYSNQFIENMKRMKSKKKKIKLSV